MYKKYKTAINITIGIIISIACLYFAFRGIDIKGSIEVVKNINVTYFIISLILSVVIIAYTFKKTH